MGSDSGSAIGPPSAVRTSLLTDDGTFPNNDVLPVFLYDSVLRGTPTAPADVLDRAFASHGWTGSWRDGIFSYHHYHSTTHEVLGVAAGTATVTLGGPTGPRIDVAAGDVLVLPAGVAHKNEGASVDFLVVGAYPNGRSWDLKRGEPGERPEADRNIEAVPCPTTDPVYGVSGPLLEHWGDGNG